MNTEPENLEGSLLESRQGAFYGSSSKLDRLVDGVRSLEQWYAVDFERRIAGLTDMLRNQITGELRAHFTSELNAHVEQTRMEYEERFSAREREWNQLRESMETEIAELRRKVPTNDVMNEIEAAEAVIHASLDSELERMMPNAVSLATLLQSRVEELETHAYLRGLKFSLPENK